jgi:hypothetical protein
MKNRGRFPYLLPFVIQEVMNTLNRFFLKNRTSMFAKFSYMPIYNLLFYNKIGWGETSPLL